jgi:hypothetical protein
MNTANDVPVLRPRRNVEAWILEVVCRVSGWLA